jgi:hypothetical protein
MAEPDMTAPRPSQVEATIVLLRKRATQTRRTSAAMLVLILLVLITGFTVFILAGTLATRQGTDRLASTQLTMQRLQVDSAATARSLAAADRVVAGMNAINAKYDSLARRQDTSTGSWAKLRDSVMAIITEARRFGIEPPGPFPLPENTDLGRDDRFRPIDSVFKGMDRIRQLSLKRELDSLVAGMKDARPTLADGLRSSFTASEVTTRIGSVIILLFLVQILVPLYRYNTRLAYFLDARADILALLPETALTVEQLIAVLAPEAIDFGKPPRTPAQEAVDLAKQLLAAGIQRSGQ